MVRTVRMLIAVAVAAVMTVGGSALAVAQTGVEVTASPPTIAVGETTTITAEGLGGLETAGFGLGDTSSGTLSVDGGAGGATADAPVSGGRATAQFTPSVEGTLTISVGDGETVLGTTTVTVTAAAPTAQASLTADPESIAVGETARITASGLGGLEKAGFGLGDTAAGTFTAVGGSGTGESSIEVDVSDGTATVEFTAAQAGSVTIAVGDGETSLATTTITVTAASASPTPSPSPTATTAPGGDAGFPAVWIWIIVLGALLIAAIVVIVILAVRRRTANKG